MPMMRPTLGSPQRRPVQGMPSPGGINPGMGGGMPPMMGGMPPNRLAGLGGFNPGMMAPNPMAARMGGMMPQLGMVPRRPPIPMPMPMQRPAPGGIMPGPMPYMPNRLAGIGGIPRMV